MKYTVCSLLCATTACAAPATDDEQATPFLAIPLMAPAQEVSGTMTALLTSLKEEKVLERIDRWQRLAELPAWAFDPKKREIGFIPPRPMVIHDYRYAVLVSSRGEVVVVRAGGRSNCYDYFLKPKKEPNQASEPMRAAVTPPADAGDRASGPHGSP